MCFVIFNAHKTLWAGLPSNKSISKNSDTISYVNENKTPLKFSTGKPGGTYYSLGEIIAEILNKTNKEYHIRVKESSGSVKNAKSIQDQENEVHFALIQNDIAYEYFEDGYDKLTALTSLYIEMIHILARDDVGINKIADLKGKIISVGGIGSGSESNSRDILHYAGLNRDIDCFPKYDNYDELIESFKKGKEPRHAAFITASLNIQVIEEIAKIVKNKDYNLKLIPLEDKIIDKFLKDDKGKGYEKIVIPANNYDFQREPINTIGVRSLLVCRNDLSKDLIEEYIKALSDNLDEIMKKMEAKGTKIMINISDKGILIPLHPGVKRFFLWKKLKKIFPYVLLSLLILSFPVFWTTKKIKSKISSSASKVFHPIENVYIVGNPIKTKEMFFGREDDFRQIRDWIINDGPKVILMKGGRRSGKTSVLLQILNGRINDVCEATFCDFHHITPLIKLEEDLPFQIGNSILNNEKFQDLRDSFINGSGSCTAQLIKLTDLCIKKIAPKKLIILGDEFEAIEDAFQSGLITASALKWVRNLLSKPIHIVMTGSHDFGDILGRIFNPVKQSLDITLLSEKDTKDLIFKPMEGKLDFRGDSADIIYRLSGGHPFYTQYICQTLVSHINSSICRNYIISSDLNEVTAFIVHNPHGHIQETWRNLSMEVKSTLAAMANTISNPKKFFTPKDILSTMRERRFFIQEKDFFESISWLKSQTHLHLLDWNSKGIRFQIDLIRHWIRYYFQTGEDIRNISG